MFSHVYTLIINPDNTYEVKIDNSKVESGKLEDDWGFLKPTKIKVPQTPTDAYSLSLAFVIEYNALLYPSRVFEQIELCHKWLMTGTHIPLQTRHSRL